MLRRLAIASVLVTAACAGQQKPEASGQPTSVSERMRITNQPPFDLGACQPRQITLPQPPNQGLLVGALLSTRPEVMECLVDPKSRAGGSSTKVTVKTRVTETEAAHNISGENLTPEGQKCVQDALNTLVPLQPLAKGAAPVEAEAQFIHEPNNSPTVTFGINEGSDFSGTVRLAQQQWCDCYASFTTQAPPVLTAKIRLTKASPTPADVTFEPSGSTEGDQLAACLKTKISTLPAKLGSDELTFPHRFIHFHSLATEASTSLQPELRFYQLELVRNQRTADTALALGTREHAATTYEALANEYRANPKKNFGLIPQLREKCAALEKAAEDWVAALERQLSVDQQTTALVQELKAKDPSWDKVEAASQASQATTQKDLDSARARRQDDAKVCAPLKK